MVRTLQVIEERVVGVDQQRLSRNAAVEQALGLDDELKLRQGGGNVTLKRLVQAAEDERCSEEIGASDMILKAEAKGSRLA